MDYLWTTLNGPPYKRCNRSTNTIKEHLQCNRFNNPEEKMRLIRTVAILSPNFSYPNIWTFVTKYWIQASFPFVTYIRQDIHKLRPLPHTPPYCISTTGQQSVASRLSSRSRVENTLDGKRKFCIYNRIYL